MLMRIPPDRMPERPPRWWRDADGILLALLLGTLMITALIVSYALSIG